MPTTDKGEFNEPTCSEGSDSEDKWDRMTIVERYRASQTADNERKRRRAERKAARQAKRSNRPMDEIAASQARLYDKMDAATKKAAEKGSWDCISIDLLTETDVLAFTEAWAKRWTIPDRELVIKHTAANRSVRYYRPGKLPRKESPYIFSHNAITYRELSRFRRIFK